MSTDCYLSAAPLTVAELDAKLAAAVALPGFRGFEPGLELRVSFEREELPPPALIAELGGSRLGAVVVTGELDPDEPESALADLRCVGEELEAVGRLGTVAFFITLDPETDPFDADLPGPDELQLMMIGGKLFAGAYSEEKAATRRSIFERVIDGLALPARLVSIPASDDFTVEHTQGGIVRGGVVRAIGAGGRSPKSWRVETSRSIGELLDRIADLDIETEEINWRAQPTFDGRQWLEMAEGRDVLEHVLARRPPAEHYTLQLHLALERLAQLDPLRGLCRADDELIAPFGSFESRGATAALDVITSAAGHHLRLEAEGTEPPAQVADGLGVELVRLDEA